jgi:hypothetical protein
MGHFDGVCSLFSFVSAKVIVFGIGGFQVLEYVRANIPVVINAGHSKTVVP